MPRISPRILKSVANIDRRLPYLLFECSGNISDAKQELSWIKNELQDANLINRACWLRYNRVPLQYILKTQPFGPLDLLVRPGVLIPRWETEEWCMDLIAKLPEKARQGQFKVLDLCSGSGCIALAIAHTRTEYIVKSVDLSPKAIALLKDNVRKVGLQNTNVQCIQADILRHSEHIYSKDKFNLITCNPPYIPSNNFVKECTTSVKLYEPRLALVADLEFYDNLLQYWIPRTESFVYEVGDMKQCQHVINGLSHNTSWKTGIKYDSNDKPRCVYGYLANPESTIDYVKIFDSFST
ncbi:S-adenosylmethionine-dependent methyltransferase [Kluyveromyces lactis]|uniref:peptide chain release factor N(5)-glutamine methyltransferase n=1 Tax=Kluyveromyces lactis (strain ATCC 8585 / CBS 2359 / DSM 70799 / NBRC 1267 / NRRL Y-1140 / WM37) TaxID=284590 RepID=Q6CLF7_KLULA|nr:uncharacterized protein KLLA0_F03355g [Kluyveromyces lactis]CAG97940.1 KLLA0F03355p [Kluyveromyces lactis]|eukprot:XP_455232.1 uncharacterized protein KLLA0_F03355g [Kluyveromyces lactis]